MALPLSATCVRYSSNSVKRATYGGRDRPSAHLSRNTRRKTQRLSAQKLQPPPYDKSLKRRNLLVKGSVKSDEGAVIPNETRAQVDEEIDWSATIFPFLFPATGGLLFGYEIGATSGAIVSLTSSVTSGTTWYDLSPLASGLIVSGSLGGAMLASAIAVVYGDYLGRKKELVGGAGLYALGASLMAFAPSLPVLICGRLIYGLGIGFTMHGAPIYIAETAPTSVRGTLISLKEGFIVGGILLGYLVSTNFIGDVGGWRSMYGAAVVPAAALAVAMCTLAESPRWLVLAGKGCSAAEEALGKLRGRAGTVEQIQAEVAEMLSKRGEEGTFGKLDFSALLRSKRAMWAGLSLVLFQQITGQPSVLYYATEIFQNAGFASAESASKVSLVLGIFKLAMTFIAVGTVDKLGRRPLLLGGVGVLTVSLFVLSVVQGAITSGNDSALFSYASVGTLLLYVGAYQVSFGPIAWLMVGEVFPAQVRSAAVGFATLTNFGTNFIVSLVLPSIQNTYGQEGTYQIFALLGSIALLSIYYTTPETMGKTLEEIEAELED